MSKAVSQTRLYRIWRGMKQRCYNPNAPQYKNYGGRGITICDEWKTNFPAFAEWSLSHGYQDPPNRIKNDRGRALSIDRIDDDKGYCPENCQWITLRANIEKQRKFALYGSAEGREFAEWLKTECIKTARRAYPRDNEIHGGWKIRDFIAYSIDQQCGIGRIYSLKDKDIPRARAFAEKVLALFEEARRHEGRRKQ